MQVRFKRIGYYMSEDKFKNNSWELVMQAGEEMGVTFIKMDLEKDLDDQGPFDRVVHKMTDELVAENTDERARQRLERFATYLSAHPGILDSEPVAKQRGFLQREKLCELLAELSNDLKRKDDGSKVQCPNYLVVHERSPCYSPDLDRASIQFPVITKSLPACGSAYSHTMGVVLTEEGLHAFDPPFIIQEYYNHNCILFKVFIIGDFLHVVRRPSLRNFDPRTEHGLRQEDLIFNSQDPPPPHLFDGSIAIEDASLWPNPPEEVLRALNRGLQEHFGVHLLGFDVITQVETGRYAVVDVNFFPSYKGVPNMGKRMASFLAGCT